jgi:hypothetical chaperone protein
MIDIVQHRQGHALAGRVERAKIELAEGRAAAIDLGLAEEKVLVPLGPAALDEAIVTAVARIDATVDATLAEAGLAVERVDTLFMTGGSTGIPAVHAAIARRFPQARIVKGDVFGSVGLGLALDAQRKFG